FLGLQTINAQYRLYNICQNRIKAGDHLLINGNDIPLKSAACPDPTGNPPQIPGFPRPPAPPGGGTSKTEEPFEFDLNFIDIQILAQLESALNQAAAAAADKWLKEQETTLRDGINRNLGTNYSNFRDAQRALFREWDSDALLVASSKGFDFLREGDLRGVEQLEFTNEVRLLKDFRKDFERQIECYRENGGDCPINYTWNHRSTVRGIRLSSIRSFAQINGLNKDIMDDFQQKEFDAGAQFAIGESLLELSRDNSFLESFVNARIGDYNNRSLRDKVMIMTAYIIRMTMPNSFYQPTPLPRIQLPQYWSEDTIRQYGIDNPKPNRSEALFGPRIVNKADGSVCRTETIVVPGPQGQGRRTICSALPRLAKEERDRIIQNHIDEFPRMQFFHDVMSTPDNLGARHDYEESLRVMAEGLRKFGGVTGGQLANYIEDIVANDLRSFTVSEVRSFHRAMKEITLKFQAEIMASILGAYLEGLVLPIAEIVATDLAFGAAFKVASKLPAVFKHPELVKFIDRMNAVRNLSRIPLSEFLVASKYGLQSVTKHKAFFDAAKLSRKKLGLEIHHILEQRFWRTGNFPSVSKVDDITGVVLTEAEHAAFTGRWRQLIPRANSAGVNTLNATKQQILEAGREVYKNHPELLRAFEKYF
ncbi:MAG: hypothetical protein AAF348_18650, partial [Bacteroidota bacterium]